MCTVYPDFALLSCELRPPVEPLAMSGLNDNPRSIARSFLSDRAAKKVK